MRCTFLFLLLCVFIGSAPAPAAAAAGEDAAVRLLRNTVNAQRSGSHLPRLAALRQMRDPSLRPFLYQIVQHEHWQVQAHAVLGLAEISEEQRIDPWLVTQVRPNAQEVIVSAALERNMLDEAGREQLLGQTDLAPMARLMLLAEPIKENRADGIPRETLSELKDHEHDRVRLFASVLLAQVGDAKPFRSVIAEEQERGELFRREHLFRVIEMIHDYRLTALTPWLDERSRSDEWPRELVQDAIIALLRVDSERGVARWTAFLEESSSYAHRVRAAMMLLAAAPEIPSDPVEKLYGDEPLIKRLIGAARALALENGPTEAMMELFRHGHRPSMEWVVNAATELPEEDARVIFRAIIEGLDDPPISPAAYGRFAQRATSELVEYDPDFVRDRLFAAERNTIEREILLLGLLDNYHPRIAVIAQQVEHDGFRREDFLATLLVARYAASLTPGQISQLSRVASDRGRLSDAHRVQAAWLQIKHSDRVDPTLTRIFADR